MDKTHEPLVGEECAVDSRRDSFGEHDAVVTADGELAIGFPRMGEKVMLVEIPGAITITLTH